MPCSFLHLTSSYPRKALWKKELSYYPALLLVSCFFSGYLLCCAQVTYFIFIVLDNVHVHATESKKQTKHSC